MDNNVFRIINKKTKEWRDMTSVEKYEYQIEENINVYFSGKGPSDLCTRAQPSQREPEKAAGQ